MRARRLAAEAYYWVKMKFTPPRRKVCGTERQTPIRQNWDAQNGRGMWIVNVPIVEQPIVYPTDACFIYVSSVFNFTNISSTETDPFPRYVLLSQEDIRIRVAKSDA